MKLSVLAAESECGVGGAPEDGDGGVREELKGGEGEAVRREALHQGLDAKVTRSEANGLEQCEHRRHNRHGKLCGRGITQPAHLEQADAADAHGAGDGEASGEAAAGEGEEQRDEDDLQRGEEGDGAGGKILKGERLRDEGDGRRKG